MPTRSSAAIDRLLEWTARLREDMTAMPWAEPPYQPTAFDRRDEQECEEFAAMFSTVRCTACGHVQNVLNANANGKQYRPDPFPPAARKQLAARDECCQRCGYTGRLEAHHRRAKASGGSSARSHTQCACNGVLLCRKCHEWVHLNPREARAGGWIVLQSVGLPASIGMPSGPTKRGMRWFPFCDGGVTYE